VRILKPNKSPEAGSFKNNESATGDLSYGVEELFPLEAPIQTKAGSAKAEKLIDSTNSADQKRIEQQEGSNTGNKAAGKKEYDRILGTGVRLLSMREHSVQEISKKLSLKCDSPDVVYAVIDKLLASKYLCNERFTESYVRSRSNRGFGPIKIRSELVSKGIKNNMIEDHLDVNSSIWYENAENQYHKKYGDAPVSDYNDWAKRARFMQSRGFSMEHIQVIVPSVDYD